MSLANVRKHWRFLATLVLVLLLVGAAGPLIFYGTGPLFSMMIEAPRPLSIALLLVFGVAPAAYFFFCLWAGNKADHLTVDRESGDGRTDADG